MTRLSSILVTEATAHLLGETAVVQGPLRSVAVLEVLPPVFVPVLRAGAAMLDGALTVWPDSPVGFLGLARNEVTLQSSLYLSRIDECRDRDVVVLEPMLATGGSLCEAVARIADLSPRSVAVIGVVASPDGVARIAAAHPSATLHFAALGGGLDDDGYIVPGLGDAGDRMYGTR